LKFPQTSSESNEPGISLSMGKSQQTPFSVVLFWFFFFYDWWKTKSM